MAELFANSIDQAQMPHSAVSDLGLCCLPITHLGSPDLKGGWECSGVAKVSCILHHQGVQLI